MSPFVFKQTLSVITDIYGEAFVWMEIKRGTVVALWILSPGETKVELVKNKAWIITKIHEREHKLKLEEVIHLKDISTDAYGLQSVISKAEICKGLMGNVKGSYKLMGSYYKHGSVAKGVLSTPVALDAEAKMKLKSAWAKAAGNIDIGGVAVCDNGIEFKPTSSNFTDYQFTELSKLTKEDIAMVFNVPIHMLNQLDKATFSNIENQSLDFMTKTIQPILVSWEEEMNYKLFTKEEISQGYCVKFNQDAALRADCESRAKYYKTMSDLGVYCINDVRVKEDMNIIEGGDQHRVSLNYVPLKIANDYQLSKAGVNNKNINNEGGDGNEGNGD